MSLNTVQNGMLTSDPSNASNLNSGTIPYARIPAGSVIQTVNATRAGGTVNTTSTSDVSFGASVSITPRFATSKIYVIATGGWGFITGSGLTECCIAVTRNGVTIPTGGNDGLVNCYGSTPLGSSYSITILDTPATTSSTTYAVVAHNINSGGSILWNGIRATQLNQITLMEIAA